MHFRFFIFQLGDWYYNLQFAARFMAYSNSALNPLIYTGFNENFRRGKTRQDKTWFTEFPNMSLDY
jgi:hypothetical protein